MSKNALPKDPLRDDDARDEGLNAPVDELDESDPFTADPESVRVHVPGEPEEGVDVPAAAEFPLDSPPSPPRVRTHVHWF